MSVSLSVSAPARRGLFPLVAAGVLWGTGGLLGAGHKRLNQLMAQGGQAGHRRKQELGPGACCKCNQFHGRTPKGRDTPAPRACMTWIKAPAATVR